MYLPTAVGVALTGPYVPSPATVAPLPVNVRPASSQSSGPFRLHVIEPFAAAPTAELMDLKLPSSSPGPALPGCVAVPDSVAVSVIAVPSVTSADAVVESVGVTGRTSKHSPELESVASGTPAVLESKKPRQQ